MLNNNMFLIAGQPSTGKSMSFMNLKNQNEILFFNCDSTKNLSFPHKFKSYVLINDPKKLLVYLHKLKNDKETSKKYKTIIIDTFTNLMDSYFHQYISENPPISPKTGKPDIMQAWSNYKLFIETCMNLISNLSQNVIITAHLNLEKDDDTETINYNIPLQGSIIKKGFESYFNLVIYSSKIALKNIEDEAKENKYLNISEDDKENEFKYVFRIKPLKGINDKIRTPFNFLPLKYRYIDSNSQTVLDLLQAYYTQ